MVVAWVEHLVVVRGEEGTSLIYCIIYQLYIYYSAVRTDHVWSCLAATRHVERAQSARKNKAQQTTKVLGASLCTGNRVMP